MDIDGALKKKMMNNFILYCKSYKGDLDRCINLSNSIKEHNKDNIPFYISVPQSDVELFKHNIPHYTEIIADETYCTFNNGWHGQQFVKAQFYRTNISRFYLALDSDSYFFKDFYLSDFMVGEDVPYMVMHSNETFYNFWDRYSHLFPYDARETHEEEYKSIKQHLGNVGKIYDFGPAPFIWDCEVWKWLDKNYGIHILFQKHCNELKWYGEGAIAMNASFYPCGPLFQCMHYEQQYQMYKQLGYEEKHFHPQYLGIVMQSNWNSPLKYDS